MPSPQHSIENIHEKKWKANGETKNLHYTYIRSYRSLRRVGCALCGSTFKSIKCFFIYRPSCFLRKYAPRGPADRMDENRTSLPHHRHTVVRTACLRFAAISFIVAEKTLTNHPIREMMPNINQVLNGNKINMILFEWGTE